MGYEVIKQDFIVDASKATGPLGTMASAAKRVGSEFGNLMGMAGIVGGLAGAFGIATTISGLNRTYQSVARLKGMLGVSAERADAMANALERSGLEADHAERIMLGLTRKAATVGGPEGSKQAAAMNKQWKALGITMKQGPEATLLAMSRAAVDGRLTVDKLMGLFGTGRRDAADFERALQRGPAVFQQFMEERKKSGSAITEQALANFEAMQQAKRNLSDAWKNVAGSFYKTIVPVATKFLTMFTEAINKWAPAAERFGHFLVSHMGTVVKLAKTYAGYMAVNKAAGILGGPARAVFGLGQAVVGGVGAAFAGGSGVLGALAGLGRLSGLAIIIDGVVHAFSELIHNTDGIRTSIVSSLSSIWGSLRDGVRAAKPLWSAFDKVGALIGHTLLKAFDSLASVVAAIAPGLKTLGGWLAKLGGVISWIVDKIPNAESTTAGNDLTELKRNSAEERHRDAMGWNGPDGLRRAGQRGQNASIMDTFKYADFGAGSVNDMLAIGMTMLGKLDIGHALPQQNFFQGAHISVEQQFAEGFDSDRVLTAMASAIGKQGERKLQSQMTPLYSARQ